MSNVRVNVGGNSGGGLGIAGVLTIIFVVLKLANIAPVATWSWVWVLSPLWISFGLAIAALVLFGIGFLIYLAVDKFRHSPAQRRRAFKKRQVLAERARVENARRMEQRRLQYQAQQEQTRREYGITNR